MRNTWVRTQVHGGIRCGRSPSSYRCFCLWFKYITKSSGQSHIPAKLRRLLAWSDLCFTYITRRSGHIRCPCQTPEVTGMEWLVVPGNNPKVVRQMRKLFVNEICRMLIRSKLYGKFNKWLKLDQVNYHMPVF